MKSTITSPKSFFGYQLGADREMARWDEIVRYFDLLGSESDRVRTIHMGPSTEGNPFLEVIITSPENFENLEEIRRISMTLADPRGLSQEEIDSLVQKGKAVCVQSMSLHATEIGGTQMAPLLAYDMAVADDPDTLRILNEVVFIMIPCFTPTVKSWSPISIKAQSALPTRAAITPFCTTNTPGTTTTATHSRKTLSSRATWDRSSSTSGCPRPTRITTTWAATARAFLSRPTKTRCAPA